MADISLLHRLIHAEARVPLNVDGNKASVSLIEPQAPDSRVEIRGLPPDAIVIKMDAFPAPKGFFSDERGECKRADYAIIAGTKKRVLFIEMKRTKACGADVVKQLQGAACVLDYCKSVATAFYLERDLLQGYEPRFVSFGHTSIPKRKTRIERRAPVHCQPDGFMKIDWPNYIQFNHLVGA